jgi:hypothetical protein
MRVETIIDNLVGSSNEFFLASLAHLPDAVSDNRVRLMKIIKEDSPLKVECI